MKDVEAKKEQADEVLKDKKKESGKIARELAKAEQEIREVVSFMFESILIGSYECHCKS